MVTRHNHKNMDIWSDGINLVNHIYDATKNFPKEEMFSLASQMQRAAISIPSNIAEGAGKGTDKEFVRFLSHSIGSLYELETQVIIASCRSYLNEEQLTNLCDEIVSLQKRISAFRNKLDNITEKE